MRRRPPKSTLFPYPTLFRSGCRHRRIVDMHQDPPVSGLAIDLSFTAVALHLCAVFLLRRREVPIEFRPRGIAMHVPLNVARCQLAFGKHPTHYVREESLHFAPAVRMAQRVDE